jgi:hypothetical protein
LLHSHIPPQSRLILALEMLTSLASASFAMPTQIPGFAGAAIAAAAAAVYL